MSFQLLHQLPEELLSSILESLLRHDFFSLNLASKWCYTIATPHIWKQVDLVDCKTLHEGNEDYAHDDHDDTPLIRKLLLFATNPFIASCVQELTHRCHLPPPAIFDELPYTHFNSQTLSIDPRTIKLVQLAARYMKNVRTLRIIFGHPGLTDALLRCFFDQSRSRPDSSYQRIRKLWLENCRISAGLNDALEEHPYDLPLKLDFAGLETIRLRRLPLRPGIPFAESSTSARFVYSRSSKRTEEMHDGAGGDYIASIDDSDAEYRVGENDILWMASSQHDSISPLETFYEPVFGFDDLIFEKLESTIDSSLEEVLSLGTIARRQRAVQAYRGTWLDPSKMSTTMVDPIWKQMQREKIPSADAAISMLRSTSATLTSLNLDWIQTLPPKLGYSHDAQACDSWTALFLDLFRCRFPHLRAFQLRNCVVPETMLPRDFYLFGRCTHNHGNISTTIRIDSTDETVPSDLAPLRFLEAHPNLQCLAWPMDRFFPPTRRDPDLKTRIDNLITNLGRTLTDLRVDMLYSGNDEPETEEIDCFDIASRTSRRRFIAEFATRMTKLTSIKCEGGVPRDERRELMRALHQCPLEKIVMIGVSNPLGDSRITNTHDQELQPPPPDSSFTPTYTWPPNQPPMLHTLASLHSQTITQLKFCGYKGAPDLFTPSSTLLSPLRHFHALTSLILSINLPTTFEDSRRDAEVISYWLNTRSATSTALTSPAAEEINPWQHELNTKFCPSALASHVTDLIAPYLSPTAKARKGGVNVRASFCLGEWGGIFDLDLRIGMERVEEVDGEWELVDDEGKVKGEEKERPKDICLSFSGPREELEPTRRQEKLEGRRWF